MTESLKKYFFAIPLLAVGLSAVVGARATSRMVEARLLDLPEIQVARKRPAPARAQAGGDNGVVAERNLFCSECRPPEPEPAEDALASDVPVATTLPLELIATFVSDDVRWTFAVLRNKGDADSGLFRVGSTVLATAEITGIELERVLLRNGSRLEYVALGEDGGAGAAGAPEASAFAPSGEEVAGITKKSETDYQVERSLIDRVLGDPTLLGTQARIVPSVREGKPNGFKIYAIRPGSLYGQLGLANGDTIHAINGHEMTTPDRALEVYTKVRNASHVTVSLTRRGKPMTVDYSIR